MTHESTAVNILRDNDRGGYCVPTRGLYPFQWLWDSGFTALGWQTIDENRAWQELHSLTRGQWRDGMIPHIVFHQPDPGYFPGPDAWGTSHTPPTSGITQPPVLATIARHLLDHARERAAAEAHARRLYPALLAYHRWLHTHRDPQRLGLISIVHPWETGEDNSPAWDAALANVPVRADLPSFERRDTTHVDASQRPHERDYQRYMTLVHAFRDADYDAEGVVATSPFRVTSPGFNSITLRADRDLRALAVTLDAPTADVDEWIQRGVIGLERLWDEQAGAYRALDQRTGEFSDVITSSCFLPLYAGELPPRRAERLASMLGAWGERVRYLVPSTDPTSPAFEAQRYWRGPVWSVVNWMIARGLREQGFGSLARRVHRDTRALVAHSGYAEYFDPHTGQGYGGRHFTWTAAIDLAWTE